MNCTPIIRHSLTIGVQFTKQAPLMVLKSLIKISFIQSSAMVDLHSKQRSQTKPDRPLLGLCNGEDLRKRQGTFRCLRLRCTLRPDAKFHELGSRSRIPPQFSLRGLCLITSNFLRNADRPASTTLIFRGINHRKLQPQHTEAPQILASAAGTSQRI